MNFQENNLDNKSIICNKYIKINELKILIKINNKTWKKFYLNFLWKRMDYNLRIKDHKIKIQKDEKVHNS